MRRAGIVERLGDGSWAVPDDYLARVSNYEATRGASRVRTLSWVGLEQLTEARAPTFLDGVLEGNHKIEMIETRFGADLNSALAARRRWLFREGLAQETAGNMQIDGERLRAMEREVMNAAAASIAKERDKEFVAPTEGARIEGIYVRPMDLPSGRFAIVEKSKEFTLVPWREVLERRRGLEISGVMKRGGVSWNLARKARSLAR